METELISVIMPVYNTKEEYLREAIESVLKQTYQNFEFIIVNDGSTNNAEDVILSYKDERIKYFKNKMNKGLPYTRNLLVEISNGDYIANVDSDDINLPTRFEKQIEYFKKNKDISICGSWIESFPQKIQGGKQKEKITYLDILNGWPINNPTVMFKKEVFDKYNLKYNENFTSAEDYELWSRAIRYVKIANIQECLLKYRLHENNITKIKKELTYQMDLKVKQNMLDFLTDNKDLQEKISNITFECHKSKIKKIFGNKFSHIINIKK